MPKRIASISITFTVVLSVMIVYNRYLREIDTLKADVEFFTLADSILLLLYFLAFHKSSK